MTGLSQFCRDPSIRWTQQNKGDGAFECDGSSHLYLPHGMHAVHALDRSVGGIQSPHAPAWTNNRHGLPSDRHGSGRRIQLLARPAGRHHFVSPLHCWSADRLVRLRPVGLTCRPPGTVRSYGLATSAARWPSPFCRSIQPRQGRAGI